MFHFTFAHPVGREPLRKVTMREPRHVCSGSMAQAIPGDPRRTYPLSVRSATATEGALQTTRTTPAVPFAFCIFHFALSQAILVHLYCLGLLDVAYHAMMALPPPLRSPARPSIYILA